ncbi:MAG: heavy-metal-associated domain-containing protein [Planctomycetes bacterium]|jgi:mercuric ion binding protein|nr:heavy-metal-associated domain-containing protein [Planctomycetota bacterium]
MKLLMPALFLLLSFFSVPAFAQCCPEGECPGGVCPPGCCEDEKCDKAANVFEVSIEGMCCKNCVKAVEKRLKKIEGVESVKVDVEKGKAWVTMKEGKTLEKASVEKSFEDTEYKTTSVVKFEPKKEEKKDGEKKEG